ncbi:alpha-glucuronidase [Flavobacterium hibisci]|uniref:alpha-glucuronidase n=1 Tax=Flavobacterium hibisci TaxID=1914462 RepID=UPI001CBC9E35|nr:alpha-glucuronidase [Flavobacterium hibisci]MBZ4040998.1 alpha-glucuronidase [Flavobacterium hibisci]
MKKILVFLILTLTIFNLHAEDGHLLWLRGKNTGKVTVVCSSKSSTIAIAKQELEQAWQGKNGAKLLLTLKKNKTIKNDGFKLSENEIQANTELGILYGAYELLRRQQTGEAIQNEICNPSYERRILNHWDNLDGSVERGYAGKSIFWHDMEKGYAVTDKDRILWKEYARANASIGINGAVLNNVNSSKLMLTAECLQKVKAIAEVVRPYGIKTYLSVKFSSPTLIGGLKTSDPLNPEVIQWWKNKAKEIYKIIPDFGGFLIKANSEGEPGPQDFGRSHADGANMLADVVRPYGGIIMWRAFVYEVNSKDRAAQAYNEFMPLDGQFRDNVIIQVKNGPVDFQPREPFNPLFGAMKRTSVMPELQITQEYLGHSEQLVYLAKMWEEFLKSDTHQEGAGSTVARTTDGSIFPQKYTAIAGVANIGLDTNWCGHHFAQSNWYAFGRMAWNNQITSEKMADEWLKLTFFPIEEKDSKVSDWKKNFLEPVKQLMLESHEAAVNYSMPLGLHHIFAGLNNTHYGPGPWFGPKGIRSDWTAAYYHKADASGIGFDRTAKGSGAVNQYHEPLKSQFENIETCPEIYLLWFHHLPWDYKMKNGRILWDELCYTYDKGVKEVREFQKTWDKVQAYVDEQRFSEVQSKLRRQSRDAQIWKDGCLLYFQQYSKKPIPFDIERPVYDLDYLLKNDLTIILN